jgi:hypothetical protein
MRLLLTIYRRLDLLQRTMRFRLAASTAVLLACAGYFVPLLVMSHDLHGQRLLLGRALAGQSLAESDEHALSLRDAGTVTIGDRTWGGPRIHRLAPWLFAEDGSIAAPDLLVEGLLADERPGWAPGILVERPQVMWIAAGIGTAFLLLVVWMELALPFVLVLAGTAAAALAARLVAGQFHVAPAQADLAVRGMGLLTFAFVLLNRALLIALGLPAQPFAVAASVVREATRSRLSLLFVILLLVILPLLPLWLDPETPLRFRIQTYISRSLGVTYALAACMTLFLACATVAFEIRDRQIWQLVSKPLRHLNYLAGKWLGILGVNAVILAIAGLSIFVYVKYLSTLPVAAGRDGELDRLAVTDEVLTARAGARPRIESLSPQELRARVEQAVARDPDLSREEVPLAVLGRMAREMQESFVNAQRSVPPAVEGRPGGNQRSYVFSGLGGARDLASTLTLRYRFHILRDDEHAKFPVGFMFNGDPSTRITREYIPTVTHVLPIPTDLVRDDGTVEVLVANLYAPPPGQERGELNFEERDFELLYKVGSFEANFFRAVLVAWVKLGFLAMLGIACSTLLSFPVACLFSFTVFLAATIGPFLALALEEYYPPEAATLDWGDVALVMQWAFQSFIRRTAQGIVFALHTFGEYRPAQSLIEGRVIPWSSVALGVLWLGVVWSGIAMLVGWLSLRNRQLAIYSGHG